MLKRLAAKLLTAIAIQPAMRGATVQPPPLIHEGRDEFLAEMDVTSMAAHRPEYHARYTGPVTRWQEQARLMAGKRMANGCLGTEFEAFVKARTR